MLDYNCSDSQASDTIHGVFVVSGDGDGSRDDYDGDYCYEMMMMTMK